MSVDTIIKFSIRIVGVWIGVFVATISAFANLVINEVEYDPTQTGNDNRYEWVELFNNWTGTIDLTGWTLTEKTASSTNTYTFTWWNIPAWWIYLIVNETSDFQVNYPSIVPDLDLPWSIFFRLGNSWDFLELRDDSSNLVDRVEWENSWAWWNIVWNSWTSICRTSYTWTWSSSDWTSDCNPTTPWTSNLPNSAPTDITLSNNLLDENSPVDTELWVFSSVDPDTGDTHTYTLVSGAWDTDNAKFEITSDGKLKIKESPDFETKNTYSIRVKTDDGNWWSFEKEFTIQIQDKNEAPEIQDRTFSIAEDSANNTVVWTSTWTDVDANTTLSYSITAWNNDNIFSIDTTSWEIKVSDNTNLDYETTTSYSLTIEVSDWSLTDTATITINITNVDDTKPVCWTWTYNPTTPTNGDVTASLTGSTDTESWIATGSWTCILSQNNTTCSVEIEDNAWNKETCTSSSVTNIDKENPVVSLVWNSPITVLKNEAYTESWATWTDNVDWNWTITIASSWSVDTSTIWDYSLEYSYTDTAGNTSTVTRIVKVVAWNSPVVNLVWNSTVEVLKNGVYTESWATWTDVEDWSWNISSPSSWSVDTSTVWDYTLTYSYTDAQGNTSSVTRIVKVVVWNVPVIHLIWDATIEIIQNSTYAELWAYATDVEDDDTILTSNIVVTWSVDTSTLWEYTIRYNVTDSAGNQAVEVIRTVKVIPQTVHSNPTGPQVWPGGGYNPWNPIKITKNPDIRFLPTQSKAIPAGKNPDGQEIFAIQNRVTDYVCPKIVKVYDTDELKLQDANQSNPFYDDIRALLMFRWLEKDEESLGITFKEYKSYAVNINTQKFRPYQDITRAEFVKMLVRSLSCRYVYLGKDTPYSDIDQSKWYAEYIKFATEQWWINGYSDGTFKPNNPITRNEAAKIFSRAIRLQENPNLKNPYADVPNNSEFLPYIKSLRKAGIMKGKTNTQFSPETLIPRTEASRMIYRTFLGGEI